MAFGYDAWRDARLAELHRSSEVVETTSGPVEFQRRGSEPYVLFFHGTPGGHDQALSVDPLAEAGLGSITPSRPGYLRTPLSSGRTFEAQADACAALLDALGVDRVVVHGASGGGPSAIQFTARHPARASCLLLSCAVTQAYDVSFPKWAIPLVMSPTMTRLQAWLLERFPRASLRAALRAESTFDKAERSRVATAIAASPESLEMMRQLAASATPMDQRLEGFRNDLEQFARCDTLPLETIRCPTLIAHGTADRDVPFAHAQNAERRIPNARLHRLENGWHVIWLSDGADEMVRAQVEFVRAQVNERD